MTLEDLGNIGEFVGAIGVIVTLAYLALQIRQSSLSTKANIRQAIAAQEIAYLSGRATEPFVRAAFQKASSGGQLTSDELFALSLHVVAGIRLFESYYYQYTVGVFSPKDWTAMRNTMKKAFALPIYREVFLRSADMWNTDFAREVENFLSESTEQIQAPNNTVAADHQQLG